MKLGKLPADSVRSHTAPSAALLEWIRTCHVSIPLMLLPESGIRRRAWGCWFNEIRYQCNNTGVPMEQCQRNCGTHTPAILYPLSLMLWFPIFYLLSMPWLFIYWYIVRYFYLLSLSRGALCSKHGRKRIATSNLLPYNINLEVDVVRQTCK